MQNMTDDKTALGLDAHVGALLCYLPLCAISLIYSIIVVATEKFNHTIRFHAIQSLLLTGIYIIVLAGTIIFGMIFAVVTNSALIASLTFLLYGIEIIAFLALMIVGMVKGFQGHGYNLPVIGEIAQKWA